MADYEIKTGTRRDIEEVLGDSRITFPTVRCYSMFYQGKLAGVAGIAIMKHSHFAFCDIKEDVGAPKMTIWKCAREMMSILAARNVRMVCEPHPDIPNSRKFLELLGWKTHDGRTYVWAA